MLKKLIYKLKRPFHFVKTGLLNGLPAQISNKFPARKLHITTITGTDGKTTSSTMLYHVLKSAGIQVGLISTVAAYVGDTQIDTGFHVTSPQPADLQRFMRAMVDQGFTHLVLEMTSHGSYQYRDWGVRPQVAGVTNIAHEHLDYHLTYDEYLAAKARLLAQAPTVVLNEDDGSYARLKRFMGYDHNIITYSSTDKLPKIVRTAILNRFPESYNQMNARLVYAIASKIGVSDTDFSQALTSFVGVPGRMESVPTRRNLDVIVDFAHTPQGLESVLTAVRQKMKRAHSQGRLIAVGGCAGLRDRAKRPLMGEIATRLADIAVFTAEDPRTEDVWSIIRQMKEQLKSGHEKVVTVADRGQAIELAVNHISEPGDHIVIFGKGPEKSMCYGTTEYPWSDVDAVAAALQHKHV